jgi:hypothetical protein
MMVTRKFFLSEIARRIEAYRRLEDQNAVEIHAAIWHRVNAETDSEFEVSGLARRIAAKAAKLPLDARIGGAR